MLLTFVYRHIMSVKFWFVLYLSDFVESLRVRWRRTFQIAMYVGLLEIPAYYICFHLCEHEEKIVEYEEWLSIFHTIMTKGK